jgi:hypothetical protein
LLLEKCNHSFADSLPERVISDSGLAAILSTF